MMRMRTCVVVSFVWIAPLQVWCSADSAKLSETNSPKWLFYKDPVIQFGYPDGWHAKFTVLPPEQGRRFWTVNPSTASLSEGIDIWENIAGQEKRPLEKIDKETNWGSGKRIDKPNRRRVDGGECLVFTVERKTFFLHCMPGSACFEAVAYAFCYRDSGNFMEIHFTLSDGLFSGQRNERYKSNAKTFDRFLGSLRFKQ